MREESDDRRAPLEFCLQLRNQRQRLGIGIVEVEHDQPGPILLFAAHQLSDGLLVVLDEANLHAQLACRLLNLRDEEQIFNKKEDLRRCILGNRNGAPLRVVDWLGIALVAAASMAVGSAKVAVRLDGRGRTVGKVAVHCAIAVVHGANEAARSALLLTAATTAFALERVIARLMRGAIAEAAAVAFKAGDIAGILLRRTLAVAVAKLFLP